MNPTITKNKSTTIILTLGLVNILIHLFCINNLEYHRDELLYFSIGMHPAFGHASVPPMIGWIAAVMQTIFGYSVFAVKLFPAILSGFFVMTCISISKELGGKSYAQILTGIAILVTLFNLRAFHLFQPVCVDLFFWTLLFYFGLRYVNTQKDKYLITIGAVFGLAMLNKYLIALLIPALLIPLFFTTHKVIFKKASFYKGLALGFIIFLPNLIWQFNNGLPVLSHMSELNESQLVNVSRINFLLDQLTIPMASSLLLIPAFFFLWKQKKYRFLMFSILFVVFTLMILRGKSYYTLGIFPMLIAAGAVGVERYFKAIVLRYAIPVVLILLTIPVLPLGLPVYKQEGMIQYFQRMEEDFGMTTGRRFEDGTVHSLPQDYADQLGWEELTQITLKAYSQIPEKDKALIFCSNYGHASAIAIIGKKYGLPHPVSFNDAFYYWAPPSFDPDIEYFIYIDDEISEDVNAVFKDIKKIGQISNIHAREYGTSVFLCSQPKGSFNYFWNLALIRNEAG